MSKNGDPFSDVDFTSDSGPKALRDYAKATAKENKELRDRLAALEAQSRGGDMRQALQDRGLDPRVARFYPPDRPTTAESVDEWVDENRDLFGVREAPNTGQPAVDTTLSPEAVAGYQVMRQLQAAEAATEMDFKSRLAAAESPDDVLKMMREFGGQYSQ